jgi:murein DD-endopeptidase MepM/ murein hydrolase activator NlpD
LLVVCGLSASWLAGVSVAAVDPPLGAGSPTDQAVVSSGGGGAGGASGAATARLDGGNTKTDASASTSTGSLPAPDAGVTPKKKAKPKAPVSRPLRVTPALGAGRYLFPIVGAVSFGDSYGGGRSDVSGGWHHGDDLFAGLGEPVVAVADGTIDRVGWNPVGGWRLWLTDGHGNSFYYAHLSGYTRLARDGATVHAGDQLGFVGNTGDAFTTAHHLHFEVHPAQLQRLGYDGAVDPTGYLNSWKRLPEIAVLPPVALPAGGLREGEGSGLNYRQLLQLAQTPGAQLLVPLVPGNAAGGSRRLHGLGAQLPEHVVVLRNTPRRVRRSQAAAGQAWGGALTYAVAAVPLPPPRVKPSGAGQGLFSSMVLFAGGGLVAAAAVLVRRRRRGARVGARLTESARRERSLVEERVLDSLVIRTGDL